ncbi:MAG: hypothetical protein ACOC7T_05435 [Planctomycetota bacterium]
MTFATVFLFGTLSATLWAAETKRLSDFEDESWRRNWELVSGTAELVGDGATHGRRALQIRFDPDARYHGAYIVTRSLPEDWSAYDALVLDVWNPADRPLPAYLLVGDRAWKGDGRTYWNRHNNTTVMPPGRTEWTIPVRGLYRGEAGSRNNDIERNIDPDGIVRVDFGFGGRNARGRIVIDNLRLVKAARPDGVRAFDFGPADQAVMPGWIPVSSEAAYSSQRGYGWGPHGGTPWEGAARDTTFGPMLLRDFCAAGGYSFHVDAEPGAYRAVLFYENSGYWAGEQAMHRRRRVLANGRRVWQETRPDGPAHGLYRFEDVEPVGVDIWETYMQPELARPVRFAVEAGEDGLTLRFETDRTWGSKLAGLALYRADDRESAAWVRGQLQQMEREFRSRAVCLDEPAPEYRPPAEWRQAGLVAWPVGIEATVTPNSVPEDEVDPPSELGLSRLAVRGEYEPFSVALRPRRDLGRCRLEVESLTGPGELEYALQVVRYNTSRDFNSLAYRVRPHTLRREDRVELPKDVTRQIVVTAHVARNAPAGDYRGALGVRTAAGERVLRVPLHLNVRPVTLARDTEFLMGFFGLMPPDAIPEERRGPVLEQTLRLLREHGMNAVSGGPSWRLTGWRGGRPEIDYGRMDGFFDLLAEHGFTGALNGYGGARFRGLHDGYVKGEAGRRVEQESGLPYRRALMRAWGAVHRHAREAGWPTILYAMCDETRVREQAQRQLRFMETMAEVARTYPETVRTSGAYSVSFERRPTDRDDLLYWHQRFFEALDISSLNRHDPTVMAEARKLGKELHIYNQGRTRYSFGLYQWSEFRKGVKARWQWHLNIIHGYQFFDLDGREPDTTMLCYGREEVYPTIHLERCREGAEDFYLYQTLFDLVQQERGNGENRAAVQEAARLLREAVDSVKLNRRRPPEGYDADALKTRAVRTIERIHDAP